MKKHNAVINWNYYKHMIRKDNFSAKSSYHAKVNRLIEQINSTDDIEELHLLNEEYERVLTAKYRSLSKMLSNLVNERIYREEPEDDAYLRFYYRRLDRITKAMKIFASKYPNIN